MEGNFDVALFLENVDSISQLKTTIYQEELDEINEKYPIKKNDINVQATYFSKDGNVLEVGFFIRNGMEQDLTLEDMMLLIEDMDGKVLVRKKFNFKDYEIPGFSGRPFEIQFVLPEDSGYEEGKEYKIIFGDLEDITHFNFVETIIDNIPEGITFEREKAIKAFANSLPTLREDEFTISVFELDYSLNRDLLCTLLFRNGTESDRDVLKLPITVYDQDEKVVAKAVFIGEKGIVRVDSGKSMIKTFKFPPENVSPGIHNLKNCRVEL